MTVNDVDTDGDGVLDCVDKVPVAACNPVTKDSPGSCGDFVDETAALAEEIGAGSSDPENNPLTYSLDKTAFGIGSNTVTLMVRSRSIPSSILYLTPNDDTYSSFIFYDYTFSLTLSLLSYTTGKGGR